MGFPLSRANVPSSDTQSPPNERKAKACQGTHDQLRSLRVADVGEVVATVWSMLQLVVDLREGIAGKHRTIEVNLSNP